MFFNKLAFGCFLLMALSAGCVPFVDVMDVNKVPPAERNAAFKIKIYRGSDEYPPVLEFLGQMKATSCKHWMWDDAATTGNALEQLRIKGYRKGADGFVNVACDSLGTNLGTNCWSSVTCSGDAVRFNGKP
ncbi:MAG: hypothetical protein KQH53_12720 [Desulfarculaceae bacterium]|nr:hypothetical protein [Desulfarculaceae bacterium]